MTKKGSAKKWAVPRRVVTKKGSAKTGQCQKRAMTKKSIKPKIVHWVFSYYWHYSHTKSRKLRDLKFSAVS